MASSEGKEEGSGITDENLQRAALTFHRLPPTHSETKRGFMRLVLGLTAVSRSNEKRFNKRLKLLKEETC